MLTIIIHLLTEAFRLVGGIEYLLRTYEKGFLPPFKIV